MAYAAQSTGNIPALPLGLDGPPPSPPSRIKPSPAMPGDDTMSLLGAMNVNGEGAGVSASSPTGRALQGVMMMMQGANLVESVIPGGVPPPILQMIQQLSMTVPEIVRNMQQMTGVGGMLSTMGMNAMNTPGAETGMPGAGGMMGMAGGMGGRPPLPPMGM